MSKKKPTRAAVHLSHHTCDRSALFVIDPDGRRMPTAWGCQYSRQTNVRCATQIEEVTCAACRRSHADSQLPREPGKWREDRELVEIAWFGCCRHHGAPPPTPTSEQRAKDMDRAIYLAGFLKSFQEVTAPRELLSIVFRTPPRVEKVMSEIPDTLRDRLAPAAHEVLLACEIAAESVRMFERAEALISKVFTELAVDSREVDAGDPVKPASWATERAAIEDNNTGTEREREDAKFARWDAEARRRAVRALASQIIEGRVPGPSSLHRTSAAHISATAIARAS
jgi:hypothetical protein